MKKIQFETLAAAGALESVCIYEVQEGYQLWAYPEGTPNADFESCLFKTAKGETRIWSSLDVLVKFVRSMGYRNLITLDTAARNKPKTEGEEGWKEFCAAARSGHEAR